jgi:hypothetical protein
MFDLEKSIGIWRRQMLTAGITAPVPLEELEIHLREEIERQIKSGLSEADAFAVAIREIGQGDVLHDEFSKVTTGQRIRRAILLMIGWVAAGCLLLYGLLCLEINWNLFGFSPHWNVAVSEQIFCILGSIAGMGLLAGASRDRASRSVALLVCVLLAGSAFYFFFHAEPILLGRSEMSPLWFRSSLTLLTCLPMIFWFRVRRRSPVQTPVSGQ